MVSTPANVGPIGLRNVANGIVSRIKSIRNNRGVRDRISRKLSQKDIPSETMTLGAAIEVLEPHEAEIACKNPKRPQTAPEIGWVDELSMSVDPNFLQHVLLVLQTNKDIARAEHICLNSKKELDIVKKRAETVLHRMQDMKDWVLERKEGILQRSANPEAEALEVNLVIAEYDGRVKKLARALLDIDRQESSLKKNLEMAVVENTQLSSRAVDQLKMLLIRIPDELPSVVDPDDFQHELPIEMVLLKEWEDDHKGFLENILEPPMLSEGNYPLRPTDDWNVHCAVLERKRAMHDQAVASLQDLERQAAADDSGKSEIGTQRELVEAERLALSHAVESVRLAGVPCRSNGSFIINVADSDFTDINYDVNVERRRLEEKTVEITDQEIKEHLDRSRDVTEQWLLNVGVAQDPDKVSPFLPHTPGSAAFDARLPDVGVGDSISVVGQPRD